MLKSENDRRAKRTKRMIKDALAELIVEKGFNNISITDLTTRADINRGTFYIHYTDKYDLLEKVENEIMEEIQEHIKDIDYVNLLGMKVVNEPVPYLVKLFQYFKENSDFMKAVLGPNGDPLFQRKLKSFMEKALFEKNQIKFFDKEKLLIPEKYVIAYIISAHLGLVQQWMESGMDKSPREMALILSKMTIMGPLKATGLK